MEIENKAQGGSRIKTVPTSLLRYTYTNTSKSGKKQIQSIRSFAYICNGVIVKMSRRAGLGTEENDNMLERDIESGKFKNDNVYELMRLRDLQGFVTKIYWLVVLCFFAIGVILAVVLSDGTFQNVFMAENLLSSIGISAYIILVVLMVMCNNHNEMRVILLLTVLFFVGCLSGFMLALHLLDVSISLVKK